MPEWKALNVGVESKDVAQDQNPEFVRVNSMFNVFEVFNLCIAKRGIRTTRPQDNSPRQGSYTFDLLKFHDFP